MDNKPTILTHSPQIPQDLALTTLITCFLFGIISIFLFDLHSWEQQFDAAYLTSLSADAIPSLIKQLPKIPQQQRCHLHRLLTKHPVLLDKTQDWRNWHWSHYQARQQWLASSLEGC